MRSLLFVVTITALAYPQANFVNSSIEKLDYESQLCMKCHNGTHGTSITIRERETPIQHDNRNRSMNHSIGMNYLSTYRNDARNYVSPASLNKNIMLIDGKVGCVSCHVAKNRILALNSPSYPVEDGCRYDKKATLEAFADGLCNQCHQK